MARIRTTKPEFYTSEQVMSLSLPARYAFQGLWIFCDDGGNHPASAKTLKAEICPSDDITATQVQTLVDEMVTQGLVTLYEVDGKAYWHVTGWHHQRIERPTYKYPKFDDKSPIPQRQIVEPSATPQRDIAEQSSSDRRALAPVLEGSGEESKGDSVPIGTGNTDAPPPPPTSPPPDLPAPSPEPKVPGMTLTEVRKRDAWRSAKSMLSEHGMPKAQTGTFLGKLAIDYGNDVLVEVIEAAIMERPAEPSAWLKASCQRRKGERAANEPAWRAEQRQRTLQAVPGIAAGNYKPANQFFIDAEVLHVTGA